MLSGASLLRQAEHAAATRASKKKAPDEDERETSDKNVSRCLRDNFKNWTFQMTDVRVRNGMTLRQQIHHDKEMHFLGEKEVLFGKHYFHELRARYSETSDPDHAINVVDDTEVLDPKLETASEGIIEKPRNFERFMLQSMDVCNQTTLVGFEFECNNFVLEAMDSNNFVLDVLEYRQDK